MGKLNIAHHKSYHPYRRDNIERVRKDEEEARLQEERAEGRMQLADAEARIEHLREKASISSTKKKHKLRDDTKELDRQLKTGVSSTMTAAVAQLPTTNGHINFFEDLEQSTVAAAIKASKSAATPSATEMGVPLAPSAKDMRPWYSDEKHSEPGHSGLPEAEKKRDERRKSAHDPLTSITKQLASHAPPSSASSSSRHDQQSRTRNTNASTSTTTPKDQTQARLSRESSERQRALVLIEKRKRAMAAGNETPSTMHGGDDDYSDQYNRNAVRAAHQDRERRWDEPSSSSPKRRVAWDLPRSSYDYAQRNRSRDR